MKAQSNKGTEIQSKGYHNLLIWKKSAEFVLTIYQLTAKFPKDELYSLTSQIRRAAISVVLNIVEGDRRKSRKDFLRFLDIADASLAEVEACLELAKGLNFIDQAEFETTEMKRREIAIMLTAFIKALRNQL